MYLIELLIDYFIGNNINNKGQKFEGIIVVYTFQTAPPPFLNSNTNLTYKHPYIYT